MLNLNDFPTELLVEIFDQLPLSDLFSTSMVCKRWFMVIRESKIGQKAHAVIDQYTYLSIQEKGHKKCSKIYVETTIGLYKSAKWQITDQILKELYDPYLKNVKTLVLQSVKITASIVQLMKAIFSLKNLRTLRILSIDLTSRQESNVDDFSETVNLELDVLEYNFTYGIDYEDVENVELLLALLKYVRKINSLSISMEIWNNENATSHIEVLNICEERCDTIKLDKLTIHVEDIDETSNVTQYLKVIDSPKLEIRDFQICQNVADIPEPICNFELNTLPALQSLDILASYCSSDELALITNHAPNLQKLHFSLHSVPDLSSLVMLKCLKTLKIFFGYEFDDIVPTLIVNPLLEVKQLEHLELSGNPHVLVVEEHALSPENCLANLRTFSIEFERDDNLVLDRKSTRTMESMLRRMKSLENFSFDKYCDLPKEIWAVIRRYSRDLKKISLRWENGILKNWKLPHLKEAYLHSRVQTTFLTILRSDEIRASLENERKASEKELVCIPENWPQLERLEAPVSDEMFEFLRVKCPHLKQINTMVRDMTSFVNKTDF